MNLADLKALCERSPIYGLQKCHCLECDAVRGAAFAFLPALIAVAEAAKPALETARASLLAWNAMGMSPEQAAELTSLYEQSPEIQQIDAALAALRRVEEGR